MIYEITAVSCLASCKFYSIQWIEKGYECIDFIVEILYEVFFAVLLFSCMFWLCMVEDVAMFHLQIPVESFFKRADDIFL